MKTGDTVYVYEFWSENIVKATLKEPLENKGFHIHYEGIVDRNGNIIDSFVGNSVRIFNDIWLTAKDAYLAVETRMNERINTYLDEINNIEDLVQFPLDHCFCGEEYTDYAAIDAYKIKVKEFLNIDIKSI